MAAQNQPKPIQPGSMFLDVMAALVTGVGGRPLPGEFLRLLREGKETSNANLPTLNQWYNFKSLEEKAGKSLDNLTHYDLLGEIDGLGFCIPEHPEFVDWKERSPEQKELLQPHNAASQWYVKLRKMGFEVVAAAGDKRKAGEISV